MALRILHAYVAGGTVLSLILINQGVVKNALRPSHVWHMVHAGNLLLFSLVAAVSVMLGTDSFRRKIVYMAIIAVQLYALYLNGTRGAWIAFAVIVGCIPFLSLKIRTLWKAGYIVALALAGVFVSHQGYFQTKFQEAMTDVKQYREGLLDTSLGGRFEMWKASKRMFMEHPILGVGVGDWVDEYRKSIPESKASPYLMQFNQPHNIYLEALSTRGLLGFASLLFFVCYPIFYVWKRKSQETSIFRNLVLMTALAMLISGLSDTLTNVRFVFMAYCALIGIGMYAFIGSENESASCRNVRTPD
jgi:O-antigen ligase